MRDALRWLRSETIARMNAGMVIEDVAGYPIRLADIARIVRGVEDDDTIVRSDAREAVGLGVMRQSQANTIAISNRVRAQLDLIQCRQGGGSADCSCSNSDTKAF